MRLAIVAEKPSLLQAFSKFLPEFYPDVDFSRTPVCYPNFGWYSGSERRFRLPRGLRMEQLPFLGEPVYRQISFDEAGGHIGVRWLGGDARVPSALEAALAYAEADVILAVVDPCYGGAQLVERFLSDTLGGIPEGKVIYPWCPDLTDAGIRRALAEARLWEEVGERPAREGRIRRYFDFNYLANALPLFTKAFHASGIKAEIPTKYALQVLYDAQDGTSLNEGRWIERMRKWKGTGRYEPCPDASIGSAASRSQILLGLTKDGLMERGGSGRDANLSISCSGKQFLSMLHPDCRDFDLPFRLRDWSALQEPEAKEKIGRYLRTYFGKQKRFMSKWPDARHG